MKLTLKRTYYDNVTLGELVLPNGKTLKTVELPNKDNKPMISCIPEGVYTLKKRNSPIIVRTTKGKYQQGWEVTNVKNRSYIMVHIGNTVKDFNGCIGVGLAYGVVNGLRGVSSSKLAFDIFMEALQSKDEWTIEIVKG